MDRGGGEAGVRDAVIAHSRLWVGADEPYLDAPHVEECGAVTIGMFGGATQGGALANEDAAVVLSVAEPHGTFAALLDAHGGSDSAQLGVKVLQGRLDDVRAHLSRSAPDCFRGLGRLAMETFSQGDFEQGRHHLNGETSVLLAATRGDYLWWFNVGDVSLFLFHHEYARVGQFAVNQRSFFEWVGRTHTFADDVPCYATGTKRLRNGKNVVLMATDGLFEQPHDLSEPPALGSLLQATSPDLAHGVTLVLGGAFSAATRDSVSVVAWEASGQGAPESSG